MIEYHKIPNALRRATEGPNRNQVLRGEYATPEIGFLAPLPWVWTEKIDGTNIRVDWDGHRVSFGGRTDNAQIPARLLTALTALFPEELLEQVFGANPVILFGEGYGAGIQKGGGNYRPDQGFILFDVLVGRWWLSRENVQGIAGSLSLDTVPVVKCCTLPEAIDLVSQGVRSHRNPDMWAEGLIGVPAVPMFSRTGERIIVKIKHADLWWPTAGQAPNAG